MTARGAWLLRFGLPRDPQAGPHLVALTVSAVAAILLTRGILAASGYPEIGGGGLHIAHVLWGDNDYFYRPAAIMYVVLVLLVLAIHALHGHRPHHPAEHLAGAVDFAVAGVAGGFTAESRVRAADQLAKAQGITGSQETAALLSAVAEDPYDLPIPCVLPPSGCGGSAPSSLTGAPAARRSSRCWSSRRSSRWSRPWGCWYPVRWALSATTW